MALSSGQLIINIGAPNSPQGSDSLLTAFNKIQDNFVNVFTEATSFSSSNIETGDGLTSTVVGGTVTLVNTGVTNIESTDTNIVVGGAGGQVELSLSSSLDGLSSITTSNINVEFSITSANITSTDYLFANNVVGTGNSSANNLTVTTSTNVGTVMRLTPTMVAPPAPSQGTIYYDGFMNMLRVYNGTTWGNVSLS